MDGYIIDYEQCDDNNTIDTDGCKNSSVINQGYTCSGEPSICINVCGNGLRHPSEGCDDGNIDNNDGCSSTCTLEHGYGCTLASPNVCS